MKSIQVWIDNFERDPDINDMFTVTYHYYENGVKKSFRRRHCAVCLHGNLYGDEDKNGAFIEMTFESVNLEENKEVIS